MSYRYLRNKNIDRERWDEAVARNPTALPYGLCWWLDAVTDHSWDGLIADDYRLVMPLPRSRSLGPVTQIKRPPFTQQCGPFGDYRTDDLTGLLNVLPRLIVSFELSLAHRVVGEALPEGFLARERNNSVLDISGTYTDVHAGFAKPLRRRLRKNGPGELSFCPPEHIISLYAQSAGQRAGLKKLHYRRVEALMRAALDREAGICCRLDDEDGFQAAGFFPYYRGRLINTFAASTALGYKKNGMARLLVALIKQCRGPGHVLDFEGSDIPGVAGFFKSFGPENRNYPSVEKQGFYRLIGKP